tara:strand:- start:383 stop:727 length:345 start_codon:yes stop_codon:yes gene_type:complete
MIEWLRWTALATAALVDSEFAISVFYLLHLNIIFGFFAMLIAIIMGAGAPTDCSSVQPERARYLSLQIVCIILWIPLSFMPFLFMKMKGDAWVHNMWILDPDEEDDEDDKKADE